MIYLSYTIVGFLSIGLIAILGNYLLTIKEKRIRGEKMSDLHDEIIVWRQHIAEERIENKKNKVR